MLQWMRNLMERYREQRQAARDIEPETFRRLTWEILDLARVAATLGSGDRRLQKKVQRITREMEQLGKLATKPEFKRLSSRKRHALRRSLLASRSQLLETVQAAPTPTSRLQ
jgi:hypothetical protein